MSPELVALCVAKYGPRWQTRLARAVCAEVPGADFDTVRRTVCRYAAGDTAPTPVSEAAIRLLTRGEGGV